MPPPAPKSDPSPGPGRAPWALGLLASLAVIATLGDPGITVDEPLDVRPGRNYVATLRARGLRFFEPATIDAVFRDNAEHPPLGRWLLGLASTLGEPFEVLLRGGPDPVGIYVVAGRLAPALAFGAMVALVASTAGRHHGRAAAWASGLALIGMPRVFAHAHLGALDTFIAFFWTLGLLAAARATARPRPILALALAGPWLGLALLTKIHAWFLIPVVLAWSLSRLRPVAAVLGWSAWLGVGLATFFAGWPWLWFDPVSRLARYLGTGIDRVSIRVLYFGQVYADRDVPWHYPWFYFAATIPVGLLALGFWGAWKGFRERRADPFSLLLIGSIGLFLALFSTNIPVYDGERLFLVAFPLFAILAGRGFGSLWVGAGRNGKVALVLLMTGQGWGLASVHPFGLSYYNLLVGGLPGAERLGLELTYWGDSVDGPLLDRLAVLAAPRDTAALAPTLAPDQGKIATTRRMVRIPLVLQDQEGAARADWLVVSRRSSYWSDAVRDRLAKGPIVAIRSRQGVWLSAIVGDRNGSPLVGLAWISIMVSVQIEIGGARGAYDRADPFFPRRRQPDGRRLLQRGDGPLRDRQRPDPDEGRDARPDPRPQGRQGGRV